MIGQLLSGRYRITEEFRGGAAAIVYKATDALTRRQVAIKVLRPEMAEHVGRDRFLREMEIAGGFVHPNIVPLLDAGETDGRLYYVMPFVEGESLRDRIRREGQLSIEDVQQLGREIADALYYAHQRGVVHRDIKPENVLIESDHAVVTDFGIARVLGAVADEQGITWTGDFVGTPGYMSPEQSDAETTVDARSDQYALGCILYEMLAGRPPFEASTAMGLLNLHREAAPPSLSLLRPAIPPQLDDIVVRCLAKTRADRYANCRDLERALRSVPVGRASSEVATATRLGPLTPTSEGAVRRVPRRQRWWWGAAGASCIALSWVVWRARSPAAAPNNDTLVALVATSDSLARDDRVAKEMMLSLAVFPDVRPFRAESLDRLTTGWGTEPSRTLLAGARDAGARYLLRVGRARPESEALVELFAVDDARLVRATRYPMPNGSLAAQAALDVLRAIVSEQKANEGARRVLLDVSTSALAVAHLEEWKRRMAAHDFQGAATSAAAAIGADSLNPIASFRLSIARYWQHDFPGAYAVAAKWPRTTGPRGLRWNALLDAQVHFLAGRGDSAITKFQESITDLPANVDGWLGLGEAIFHYGWLRGRPQSEAEGSFAQIQRFEPSFVPVDDHRFDIAFYRSDTAAAHRYLSRLSGDPDEFRPRQLALALAFGTPPARAAALRALENEPRKTLSITYRLFATRRFRVPLSDTVARILTSRGALNEDRLRGAQYRMIAASARSEWLAAVSEWRSIPRTKPVDAWRATLGMAVTADSAAALAEVQAAERFLRETAPRPADWMDPSADVPVACMLVAQARLLWPHVVDSRAARLHGTTATRGVGDPTNPVPASVVRTLDASDALMRRDTTLAIRLLEQAIERVADFPLVFSPALSLNVQRAVLAGLVAPRDSARTDQLIRSFMESPALTDPVFVSRFVRDGPQ